LDTLVDETRGEIEQFVCLMYGDE